MKFRFAILAVMVAGATACNRGGVDQNAFEWASDVPAGATVHLLNGAGGIRVRPAVGQSALVTASRRWRRGRSSDIHFVVTHRGNDYYVCAMWRNSGKCGANGYRGRNTGGFLAMFSLFHRTTDAAADFVASVPANVIVDARTSNGSVNVDGVRAGVTARTSNGDVQAVNVAGPLSLTTSNGNVQLTAEGLAANDSVNLSTKNGVIHAELPAETQGTFDLSVVNGSVRSDFPLTSVGKGRVGRHLQGQVGASTRPVKMRTLNGTVVVTSRTVTAGHE